MGNLRYSWRKNKQYLISYTERVLQISCIVKWFSLLLCVVDKYKYHVKILKLDCKAKPMLNVLYYVLFEYISISLNVISF